MKAKDLSLPVKVTEYLGSKRPLFMRSVRAEGETEDGRKIEVAVNELGAGIIVTVDGHTFLVSEFSLVDAVLDHLEEGLTTD